MGVDLVMTIKLLELFGGIGAASKALKEVTGGDVEVVDYVEKDRFAVASYNAINGTSFEPQDITQYHPDSKAIIDLLMSGSPCQDFSVSGKQAGGVKGSNTRSSLLYETIRIIDELEVKPRYVVWENVKNVLCKNHFAVFNSYLQELKSRGYTNYFKVLNAKDYCIPQNRERLFVVSCYDSEVSSYAFPAPRPLNSCMRDYLIPQTDESSDEYPAKYLYQHNDLRDYDPATNTCLDLPSNIDEILNIHEPTDRLLKVAMLAGNKYTHRFAQIKRVYWEWGLCPTITTQSGGGCEPKVMREYDVAPYFRIREVRAIEQWRLMGFSDEDFDKAWPATGLSFAQMRKQAGNSICVPVLRAVFVAMKLQ